VSLTEQKVIVDKFFIYQVFSGSSRVIKIGKKSPIGDKLYKEHSNPIKKALFYQNLLDEGLMESQAEISKNLGVVRARISHFISLLKLCDEIKEFILDLSDEDEKLKLLNERKLRNIANLNDECNQLKAFWKILDKV
jgi:hypothetical protein